MKIKFLAKNVEIPDVPKKITNANVKRATEVTLYSPSCDEADQMFSEEINQAADEFAVSIKSQDEDNTIVDVSAIWTIKDSILRVTRQELEKIRNSSKTWGAMVGVSVNTGPRSQSSMNIDLVNEWSLEIM